MQKFCHHCGKQVVIGANFCMGCGTNLNSLANTPNTSAAKPSQFTPFAAGADDDDDDSYLDKMQHLNIRQNSLQVEIIPDRPQGETMQSLVAGVLRGGGPPILEPDRPPQYTNNAQFLADFQKEGGTSRGNS